MSEVSGEQRLRKSIRTLRRTLAGRRPEEIQRPPIDLRPTTPFQQAIITRLDKIEQDLAEIQARHEWIIRLVIGGLVAGIINLLI